MVKSFLSSIDLSLHLCKSVVTVRPIFIVVMKPVKAGGVKGVKNSQQSQGNRFSVKSVRKNNALPSDFFDKVLQSYGMNNFTDFG